jgi:CheY-like chemotaxis protein
MRRDQEPPDPFQHLRMIAMARQILLYSPQLRVREILVAGIMQYDFCVSDTGSPYLAVIAAAQQPVDLLIVDVPIFDTRGMLVVRAFRKSSRTAAVPILLTIPSAPDGLLDALCVEYFDRGWERARAGLSILRYPYNFSDLIGRLEALLAGSEFGRRTQTGEIV